MGNKINDPSLYPATVPAATDRVLGIDVSDTGNDANGEVVSFQFDSIPISLFDNDSGFITDYTVTTADVTAAGALMDSEVTNLTQVKAFNSADYATAAQGTSADTAFGWGNHASGGYLTGITAQSIEALSDVNTMTPTDGQVLTWDNGNSRWDAADASGGGGGLVPIGAPVSASNDSAIDIGLTGGHSKYRIICEHVTPADDNRDFLLQASTDGGSTFETTNYNWGAHTYIAAESGDGSASDSSIKLGDNCGSDTAETGTYVIDVFVSDGVGYSFFMFQNSYIYTSGIVVTRIGTGALKSTTAITDIRFLFNAGNVESGDFQLYYYAEGA